jgi:hypothetical protein
MKPNDAFSRLQAAAARREQRLTAIEEAAEAFLTVLHTAADGSAPPGEHQEHIFVGERMKLAARYVEIALLLALREIESREEEPL